MDTTVLQAKIRAKFATMEAQYGKPAVEALSRGQIVLLVGELQHIMASPLAQLALKPMLMLSQGMLRKVVEDAVRYSINYAGMNAFNIDSQVTTVMKVYDEMTGEVNAYIAESTNERR